MSRKKHREQRIASSTAIGTATPPAQSATTATLPRRAPVTRAAQGPQRFLILFARIAGSLQAAVILLSLFGVVLIIGTMMESWYSARIAQELVYRAWWFTLLLTFLWITIFFAAAKKWPWKKHQTGFLITHLGLLTMVGGGIFTSVGGTDSMMNLIDTTNERVIEHDAVLEQFGLLENKSSSVILQEEAAVTVKEYKLDNKQPVLVRELQKPFEPGSFLWKREKDEFGKSNFGPLMTTLAFLSHPLPRQWDMDLGDGATLEVLAFYPNVVAKGRDEFVPDLETLPGIQRAGNRPAAKCRITMGKESKTFWMPLDRTQRVSVGTEDKFRFFQVEYRHLKKDLGFELKLVRAEQLTDPGGNAAATYTSWVELTDPKENIDGELRMITMNEPLNHRGYKVYQSNYMSITHNLKISDPTSGRPVSFSGFTVGRDPGLWMKYAGFIMVSLGIFCMFYMKAYFFKPKTTAKATTSE